MTNLFRLIIMCALISISAVALGEELPAAKVVLHLNDSFKIAHLRNSVINLHKEMGENVDIKIVVNGKAVTRLLRSNVENGKIVKSILDRNVPIELCHNAVSNNKVKPEMLIEGLEVLEQDGNVTILAYQKQGYLYIKL